MKTYNDNLFEKANDGPNAGSLAEGTGEPRDPPCPRAVEKHGFGQGVKRHIPTGEEMKETERRMLERHGMGRPGVPRGTGAAPALRVAALAADIQGVELARLR